MGGALGGTAGGGSGFAGFFSTGTALVTVFWGFFDAGTFFAAGFTGFFWVATAFLTVFFDVLEGGAAFFAGFLPGAAFFTAAVFFTVAAFRGNEGFFAVLETVFSGDFFLDGAVTAFFAGFARADTAFDAFTLDLAPF